VHACCILVQASTVHASNGYATPEVAAEPQQVVADHNTGNTAWPVPPDGMVNHAQLPMHSHYLQPQIKVTNHVCSRDSAGDDVACVSVCVGVCVCVGRGGWECCLAGGWLRQLGGGREEGVPHQAKEEERKSVTP
jgi:hypothetical protein